MSGEIRVNASLQIIKNNLSFVPNAKAFQADMAGQKGPSPGMIVVATGGTQIIVSQLSTPGIALVTNVDPTNYIEIGLTISATFYPLIELQPGESYVIRFSRNLTTSELYAKANTGSANLLVEAFDA